jgi:hypothetical protein
MTAPNFRAVDAHTGEVVTVISERAERWRARSEASDREAWSIIQDLTADVQTAKAGAAIAREKNLELETTVEGLAVENRRLEAANAELVRWVANLERDVVVARGARDTANAINGGQR